jgi:class 3 adenylate cyclase/tetratricopeptide (TPR) repeat protein
MTQPMCERCGNLLPADARFCPNCGYPVGAPPPEERKVVTVVFVDLVGSTKLSTRIDPERFREVLAAFYQTVTEELESLRGRAYNFAGDAVVGVFGIPTAHDDDALRAIRAGLALAERVPKIGESMGLPSPLLCRVGVNTGQVAIGSESSERGLLFGAVVNLAARLQQSAEPGTVLVGDTTWLLANAWVEFGERIEMEAKGFEEGEPAYPVRSLLPRSSRRVIPFVDRRRELGLLRDTYERAIESKRGHMVTLLGEPGIGKSRVAEEFLSGLPVETQVLTGRASRFEEDVTFAPLAQMLMQQLGDRSDMTPEVLKERLHAMVAECCPEDEIEQVVARLGLALGMGAAPRSERRYRVAEIRSGLIALLRGLCLRGPVVLVFEDLHMAQPPLLELVEHVVRDAKRIPLLVLCVARYDLLDDRPEWGGGLGDSLNLYLEAMSLEDATALALEASEGLDESTADRIARHAGGNPFFIVETTGMLLHSNEALPSDTGPLPGPLLPPTVQAVIAARIDHLAAEARDLIRKASVFARSTFDVSELALITEPDEKVLTLLEDEELMIRDEERSDVWRFRHGLVRDVAYESLPKRERQRLHLLVADKLSEDLEMATRMPRSIAYHLEQAARASLDLNPGDRSVADRAVESLSRVGDLALQASEARPAADLFERALALAGPERRWERREAHILSGLGEARYWLGEFESAVSPLTRALELGGDRDAEIRAHASRFLGDIELSVRGNRDRAGELFDSALAAARELGEPWTLARTLLVAGWAPYWLDEMDTAAAMFQEALEVARSNPDGDPWAEARALGTLATIASETGDELDSLALASEALSISESTRDRFSVSVAREAVGNALRRQWRLQDAVPHLDGAVETFRELGARWELASALTSRGNLRRMSRQPEDAVRDVREALRLCRELKERSILDWTAGTLIDALAEAGDTKAARQILEDAVGWGAWEEGPDRLQVAEVRLLFAEGDREASLERARTLLEEYRAQRRSKDVAGFTWWVGSVFGADEAGGAAEVQSAKELLEATHWIQALREPELVVTAPS